jgi:hypothetical protein
LCLPQKVRGHVPHAHIMGQITFLYIISCIFHIIWEEIILWMVSTIPHI